MATGTATLLGKLEGELPAMLSALEALVNAESPTADIDACARTADVVAEVGARVLGREPEAVESGGRRHLRWPSRGAASVGLLGHFDTVWPLGTLGGWPFAVEGRIARGPGIFDMKAGAVQGLFALAALDDPAGVELLLTSDEEFGSPTSRELVEDLGRRVDAVLVLEPSAGGHLKVARKGISMYRLEVTGRASHAGLDPEKGVNALVELAHQVPAITGLAEPGVGTTVTPTVAAAGTAKNVVPASASLSIDVRAATVVEQQRVDQALRRLTPVLDGATLRLGGGPDRPPLERERAEALFARARELARANGLGELDGVMVGGGSDGNLTAALGTPTLDGLGAVGDGAHAVTEHIVVAEMPRRAALVAWLAADLLGLRA